MTVNRLPPTWAACAALILAAILLPAATATAEQSPYDVMPPADPPYYRVRYAAATEPGALRYPVNYTVWIPPE